MFSALQSKYDPLTDGEHIDV